MPATAASDAVVRRAVAEARRRASRCERDLAPAVAHYEASLKPACTAWGLTALGTLDGGAGMPAVDVVRVDGVAGVLKVAQPGSLDDSHGYPENASIFLDTATVLARLL